MDGEDLRLVMDGEYVGGKNTQAKNKSLRVNYPTNCQKIGNVVNFEKSAFKEKPDPPRSGLCFKLMTTS